MGRRAASALAAVLAVATVALPATLGGAATPAAAATTQSDEAPASVAFTGMSPQWAGPTTTITVTGTVRNSSSVAQPLVVQLFYASTPIGSVSELVQSAAGLTQLADVPLTTTWQSAVLRPGAAATWSFRVPASSMGLTAFGVYPIVAQVSDTLGTALNTSVSYLPYVPAKKGPDASTVPATDKIAWVWPLIDQPLLGEPWQNSCTGPQAAALARSLGSGGRLGQLLDAAAGNATTAVKQAQAASAGSSETARNSSSRVAQPESLADTAALTWAIDPALLANVSALAGCGAGQPQWSATAASWLSKLKAATASQPLFVTAYGDPDMSALISAGATAADVTRSYSYGRSQAGQILGRDVTPPSPGSAAAAQPQAAGIAWSAGGSPSYSTLETLANNDDVSTIILGSSAFGDQQTSVLRTPNGGGGYLNVLLASDSLTSLLGSGGSAFSIAQEYLAETALLAQDDPGVPIVVAPPQRWQVSAGLAADLLSETASAPWLSPASLTSLTTAQHIPTVDAQGLVPAGGRSIDADELSKLNQLDQDVDALQELRAQPDANLYLAVGAAESSAYAGQLKGTALAMIATLTSQVTRQQQGIHIVAESRITLGGLRGTVPVSIDSRLRFAVQVELRFSYDSTSGTKVTPAPPGVITVPAHTSETVKLRIANTRTGSTTITMSLADRAGRPLAAQPVRMTVQTTQVGQLGMIILAVALGVFLIASAARAVRRGRNRPTRGGPGEPERIQDDQPGHSTEEAAPDTVVTEHTELGTAGTPRPR